MRNKKILTLVFVVVFLALLSGCGVSNHIPIITSDPITAVDLGETYTYDVNATDPDDDTLTYSLDVKPTGMTINSATGLVKWKPTKKGSYAVVVRVSDEDLSITQSFTIVVSEQPTPVNHAPIITSIPGVTAIVEVGYIYNVIATDPDGDVLTYSLPTKPDRMLIDKDIGIINWIPTAEGDYDVTVKVSDGEKATTQSFTITVKAVKLTSIVVNPKTMDLIVGEFEAIKSVTAHYSDWSTFVIDGPGYDYGCSSSDNSVAIVSTAHVVEAVAEGTATITVSYTEGGETETDTIKVTVKAVELTGIEVDPMPMTLFVGEIEFFKVTANYDDGDTKNVTNDCVYVSNDPTIAKVLLVSPNDYQKSVKAVGEGTAKITVCYGGKTDTLVVKVNPIPILLTSIVVLPETMSLKFDLSPFGSGGESKPITSVTAHYNFGPTKVIDLEDCDYKSSDNGIAIVSNTGVVTAAGGAAGTATITVTYEGKTDKIAVTVTLVTS